MKLRSALYALFIILVLLPVLPSLAHALPSDEFYSDGPDIFDDWGISRTRHAGSDGFLGRTSAYFDPLVVQEGLGDNADLAWELGEEFAIKYPDRHQRAEQIFYFVRDRVFYTSDSDQFGLDEFAVNPDEIAEAIIENGVAEGDCEDYAALLAAWAEQIFYFVRDRVFYTSDSDQFGLDEFAVNPDEIAEAIIENGVAEGDCEDYAALLAVMYKAAGFRSAIVLVPGHVATLVYLPEYWKAHRKMDLAGEGGWVWAEATMDTNLFGWLPESAIRGEVLAREVTTAELPTQDRGPLVAKVQRDFPGRGPESPSVKGLVVLVGAVGILVAIMFIGKGAGLHRPGRRDG